MAIIQSHIDTSVTGISSKFEPNTICCDLDGEVTCRTSGFVLSGERLLAAQALHLLIRLEQQLKEARADWNQDRFRRLMRARCGAVSRVRRRWNSLHPAPAVSLGKLRRRYHANLAGYLYAARTPAIVS